MAELTTYVVLIEDRTVVHHHGDIAFVLLGFYDARDRKAAIAAARIEHGLLPSKTELVAVPGRYWGSW